jgi:hypothetical protein
MGKIALTRVYHIGIPVNDPDSNYFQLDDRG